MTIQIEKLINLTIEVMLKYCLTDLSIIKITRSKEKTNVWNEICNRYYGAVDYKNVLKLYQWWERDTQNYSSLTKTALKELNTKESKTQKPRSNVKKLIITFNSEEWTNALLFSTSYDNRVRFKSEFSTLLSERIQNKGVNCWLKCVFNWIRKKNSLKTSSPFWNGLYRCIDCSKSFKAQIHQESKDNLDNKYVLVFIEYKEQMNHKEKVNGKIRCVGDKRTQQAKELLIDSTCNVISNNILENLSKESSIGNFYLNLFNYSHLINFII